MNPQDHDLLIRVDEKVSELKKMLADRLDDHEARLRIVEKDIDDAKGQVKGIASTVKIIYGMLALLATAFGGGAFVFIKAVSH